MGQGVFLPLQLLLLLRKGGGMTAFREGREKYLRSNKPAFSTAAVKSLSVPLFSGQHLKSSGVFGETGLTSCEGCF